MMEVEEKYRKTVQSERLGVVLKLLDSLDPETSMLLPLSGGEHKDPATLDQYPVKICPSITIVSLRSPYARLIADEYVTTPVYSKN